MVVQTSNDGRLWILHPLNQLGTVRLITRADVFLAFPMETSKLTSHIHSEHAHIQTPIESHPPAVVTT